MALQITSSAFSEGGMIPERYTCDGTDVSPDLAWTGIPEGTRSLALICDDPDAPRGPGCTGCCSIFRPMKRVCRLKLLLRRR